MADHTTIQLALRARLLTLSVATTGATSLSATSTGYARAAGSFVADGFARGMEIAATGFATNGVSVITDVQAGTLTVTRLVVTHNSDGSRTVTHPAMVAEAAASGRTLVAGIPSLQAWENTAFEPVTGHPYIEEQYIPGPESIGNDNYDGLLTLEPMYSPRVHVPLNSGISADGRYADAIRRLFVSGTRMTLTGGDVLEVTAPPTRGQRFVGVQPGYSTIPVTIPLRALTAFVTT